MLFSGPHFQNAFAVTDERGGHRVESYTDSSYGRVPKTGIPTAHPPSHQTPAAVNALSLGK